MKANTTPKQWLLTLQEMAVLARLSVRTIQTRIEQGVLLAVTLADGRTMRITASAARAFLGLKQDETVILANGAELAHGIPGAILDQPTVTIEMADREPNSGTDEEIHED